jgi:cyclopropane fatty-acyl-phospholipid synthase-like methyltransferase
MKQFSEAADRNKSFIFEVIEPYLKPGSRVLEIASGTGQHAAYFCERRPDLVWQPTDIDAEALASIKSYRQDLGLNAFREAITFDIRDDVPMAISGPFDAMISINMIHISPWQSCLSLADRGSALLKKGAILALYGPFLQKDTPTAPSNHAFDLSLKSRNPEWGIRSLETVKEEFEKRGLHLDQTKAMPANNLTLVFKKS